MPPLLAEKLVPTPAEVVLELIFVADPSPTSDSCVHCAYRVRVAVGVLESPAPPMRVPPVLAVYQPSN